MLVIETTDFPWLDSIVDTLFSSVIFFKTSVLRLRVIMFMACDQWSANVCSSYPHQAVTNVVTTNFFSLSLGSGEVFASLSNAEFVAVPAGDTTVACPSGPIRIMTGGFVRVTRIMAPSTATTKARIAASTNTRLA